MILCISQHFPCGISIRPCVEKCVAIQEPGTRNSKPDLSEGHFQLKSRKSSFSIMSSVIVPCF